MLTFFFNYFFFLLFSAVIIVGFWGASRGHEITENFKKVRTGPILNWWYWFWYDFGYNKGPLKEKIYTVMAGCITCAPTFYGNLIYWLTMFLVDKKLLSENLFYPFANNFVGIFVVWISYWISLSFLTTYLWKKYDQ